MYVLGHPLLAITNILASILWLYSIIVLAAVVLSFFISFGKVSAYHPVSRILISLTEPVYKRIRRYIKPMGNIDLSPLIVLLLISFIDSGILPVIRQFAVSMIN